MLLYQQVQRKTVMGRMVYRTRLKQLFVQARETGTHTADAVGGSTAFHTGQLLAIIQTVWRPYRCENIIEITINE